MIKCGHHVTIYVQDVIVNKLPQTKIYRLVLDIVL